MRIWVDLANAPHVLFFAPLIRTLEQKGHEVLISLRDFGKTVELSKQYGVLGTVIGRHGGKRTSAKLINFATRTLQLMRFGCGKRIDICVSHNSYPHTVAGRLVGSRVVTIMDYEGQPANHIAFRAAHKIIVPECFPRESLARFGALRKSVFRYHGFKEQVYLSEFSPRRSFVNELKDACGLPEDWNPQSRVLVTLRAPAFAAIYHPAVNHIYGALLDKLSAMDTITTIVLPRTREEEVCLRNRYPRLYVPRKVLSGADLIFLSDLVISAGGTMNREAAILGTPAVTIFAGALPAVDRKLIEMGRLMQLEEGDIDKVSFQKKVRSQLISNKGICEQLLNAILTP